MNKKEALEIAKKHPERNRILILCELLFQDKKDKAGRPYLYHLNRVAEKSYQWDGDYVLTIIGKGHDLFEDTDVTPDDLVELGISARVIKGISDLTKWNGQGYEEYKIRVKSNPDAIKVKIADLEHNMDITRLKKPLTEKDLARIKRYHDFWLELGELDK